MLCSVSPWVSKSSPIVSLGDTGFKPWAKPVCPPDAAMLLVSTLLRSWRKLPRGPRRNFGAHIWVATSLDLKMNMMCPVKGEGNQPFRMVYVCCTLIICPEKHILRSRAHRRMARVTVDATMGIKGVIACDDCSRSGWIVMTSCRNLTSHDAQRIENHPMAKTNSPFCACRCCSTTSLEWFLNDGRLCFKKHVSVPNSIFFVTHFQVSGSFMINYSIYPAWKLPAGTSWAKQNSRLPWRIESLGSRCPLHSGCCLWQLGGSRILGQAPHDTFDFAWDVPDASPFS